MEARIIENNHPDFDRILGADVDGFYPPSDSIYAIICLCGTSEIETLEGETYPLRKRAYALLYNKAFRFKNNSDDFLTRILIVNRKFLKNLIDIDMRLSLNKLFCRPRVLALSNSQFKIFDDVTRHLMVLLRYESMNYSYEIITGYLKVFTYSSLWAMDRAEQTYDFESKRENDIADKFITLVKENYTDSRRVSFYAEKLNIAPKYLAVLVKKATGRQPSEWIDDYTISEIKRRLATTSQPMQEMSFELGFSTPSHMTKFFHDKTGRTPKEYRRSKYVKNQL